MSVPSTIKRFLGERKKGKIFGVGFNKTGTSSLLKAMADFRFKVAPQEEAELLLREYAQRDFRSIADYCEPYDFFQDVPFSYPFTFVAMDQFFPKSKFILTVRSSGEQWYNSLVNFHSKRFGNGIRPTAEDLKNATYRYKGFMWVARTIAFGATEEDPYPKDKLIGMYQNHNETVKEYFRFRPDDLLILNPADSDAYPKLCKFLNKTPLYEQMPWENKT